MRLIKFVQGRLTLVSLSSVHGAIDIENFILQHAKENDLISNLSLDFCGDIIPLTSVAEARLAARLLASYACIQTPDEEPEEVVYPASENEVNCSSSDSEFPAEFDPDYEMNEDLGEPEFGKANMLHHLW